MRDIGHDQTEKVLENIEKRISKEYARAEKEIAKKLDEYLKKFQAKDKIKRKAVKEGKITEEEYKQWRVGQVMMGERWDEMRESLAEDFANSAQIARSIAFEHMPEVYAINHDYGTFQVEKGSMMDTSYTLYDRHAMEELIKNEDTFIPGPGKKITRAINDGEQVAWDKKQIQSVMMQGLLQGESIPNLASRLADTVGDSDRKAAIRNARTMTTGVENAGRLASYDRANKLGIETRKQWLAALDSRTRHWHAKLDGVTVDNDKPFENDYGEIMYPGDPTAHPANIFNCRCTLIASIKGFERDVSDTNLRHDKHLKDISYNEWHEGHYEQTSDPITKQDTISGIMKRKYMREYGMGEFEDGDESDSFLGRIFLSKEQKAAINEVRKAFSDGLDNVAFPKVKTLLEEADARVWYRPSKTTHSRFRLGIVELSEEATPSALAHELFHDIDWKYRITKKGALKDNLKKDFTELTARAKAKGQGVKEYLMAEYNNAFDGEYIKEKYRGLSDIIHGCSNTEVFLGFGHKKAGYWEQERQLEKETLAQAGRMLYDNNRDVLNMFRTEFPGTYSEIIKILEGL